MTLQQLKYLLEVARQGSINKAAKSLFVSQPSISRSISELEKELGITLFVRTNEGVSLSEEGKEFLHYAKRVVKHADILEEKFISDKDSKQHFYVSTQHYALGLLSFAELIKQFGSEAYDFRFRETEVQNIIDDVRELRSEVGIVYVNRSNERSLRERFLENNLEFNELCRATPRILVSSRNPLAQRDKVALNDLWDYPYVSYMQDELNAFSFSEEILSAIINKKSIKVTERATLMTMIFELDGYTISTGIISNRLKNMGIVPIELELKSSIVIGTLTNKDIDQSDLCVKYIQILKNAAAETCAQ